MGRMRKIGTWRESPRVKWLIFQFKKLEHFSTRLHSRTWHKLCLVPEGIRGGSWRHTQHRRITGVRGWGVWGGGVALWQTSQAIGPFRASASSCVRWKNDPGWPPRSFLHLMTCLCVHSFNPEGTVSSENSPTGGAKRGSQGTQTPYVTRDKLNPTGSVGTHPGLHVFSFSAPSPSQWPRLPRARLPAGQHPLPSQKGSAVLRPGDLSGPRVTEVPVLATVWAPIRLPPQKRSFVTGVGKIQTGNS